MSFTFNWEEVERLETSYLLGLIKENLKPLMMENEQVYEIHFDRVGVGTIEHICFIKSPEIEILEVADFDPSKEISSVILVKYEGDAYVDIRLRVQLNSVLGRDASSSSSMSYFGVLAAHKPRIVDLRVQLSHLRLSGRLKIRYNANGNVITAQFDSNPLRSMKIRTSLDSNDLVRGEIRKMILEGFGRYLQTDYTLELGSLWEKAKKTA